MNLALIKDGIVVNVIVVDGDGSAFLAANSRWAAQFDETVAVDPAKVRCCPGDERTGGGFEEPASVPLTASEVKMQAIELNTKRLAIQATHEAGIDCTAELAEIETQIADLVGSK